MDLRKLSWVFYIVGTAIVLASWLNIVDSGIGWVGWVIAMIGWGIPFLPGVKRSSVSAEIARLEQLREKGTLTEEEFQLAKDRLLREGQ